MSMDSLPTLPPEAISAPLIDSLPTLPPEAISAICSYWGIENDSSLLFYTEIRTLEQSDICIISHRYNTEYKKVFCKQASIERLKKIFTKSNEGWQISFESFLNEQRILSSVLDFETISSPRCIFTSQAPVQYLESHTFTTLSEYINIKDHIEYRNFTRSQVKSALSWLSIFHKKYWNINIESTLTCGGWWRKSLRPTVDYNSIPEVFCQLCKSLPQFVCLDTIENHSLMNILTRNIDILHNLCSFTPFKTLLHGDFKPSNIFFKANGSVVAIDYQWSGLGNGVADVAYLLVGGVCYEDLDEETLLDYYYTELTKDSSILGYTRTQFRLDFDRELLAYFSTALPYLLKGLTPELCVENAKKYGWLTHEEDERVTMWLTTRALKAIQRLLDTGLITA
jgi:hypothetical protein